jgi:hypothetical protein
MNYPAHERQFKIFVKIGLVATTAIATTVVLMAIFLT